MRKRSDASSHVILAPIAQYWNHIHWRIRSGCDLDWKISQTGTLQLNPDKSEALIVGTADQLHAVTSGVTSVSVAGVDLSVANDMKALGVVIDRRLTSRKHAMAVARSCNYHSRAIRHIRHLLSTEHAVTLACSLILTRPDYCNSVLYGAPASSIQVLQRVQNNAARIVLQAPRRSHASHYCVSCIGCPFNTELSTRWLCWPSRAAAAPQHRHTSVVTWSHQGSRQWTDTSLVWGPTTWQAVHQDRLRETSFSLFCANCLELVARDNNQRWVTCCL